MKGKRKRYIRTITPVSLPLCLTTIWTVPCDVVANIVHSTMPTRSVTVTTVEVCGTYCNKLDILDNYLIMFEWNLRGF